MDRLGILQLLAAHQQKSQLPLVIGYHRVTDDFASESRGYMPSMLISTAMLEQQIEWLARNFELPDPDHALGSTGASTRSSRPAAIITFDDGYRDVYDLAFPILRRMGIPAIVFVVSDLVGTRNLQVHDRLYLLLERLSSFIWTHQEWWQGLLEGAGVRFTGDVARASGQVSLQQLMRALFTTQTAATLERVMDSMHRYADIDDAFKDHLYSVDWSMLKEMQHMGMTIGSNTRNHVLLTNESPAKFKDELDGARRTLARMLGTDIVHLAYPDGRFNHSVVEAAAASGYSAAYTTCGHRDPVFPMLTIPRILIWEKSSVDHKGHFSHSIMHCQMSGVFDFTDRCRLDHAA